MALRRILRQSLSNRRSAQGKPAFGAGKSDDLDRAAVNVLVCATPSRVLADEQFARSQV